MLKAARAYVQRKNRWKRLVATGREVARRRGLRPGDVSKEIAAYHKSKAASGAAPAAKAQMPR